MNSSHTIYKLLRKLEETDIPFSISRFSWESITVIARFSKDITAFEVFEDGKIEVFDYQKTPSILRSLEDVFDFIDGYNYEE